MDTCELTVWPQHVGVLDLLQVSQPVQIDVSLKQAAIWNVSGNFLELQCLVCLVEFQEVILASMKRAPDLVESVPLPDPAKTSKRPDGICRQFMDSSGNGGQ